MSLAVYDDVRLALVFYEVPMIIERQLCAVISGIAAILAVVRKRTFVWLRAVAPSGQNTGCHRNSQQGVRYGRQ